MLIPPPHNKTKSDRIDAYATFADHIAAVRKAMAAQDQSTMDDLIYNFQIGAEPVRRVSF
jgi:hypothetical protein